MTDHDLLTMIELTSDEVAALQIFRRKYGARGWKLALRDKWNKNRSHLEDGGEHLKRIGEELGPDWLRSYILPEEMSCTT